MAPVYSTETAVGLVIGTGNLGARLTGNDEPKNLYISRDGGLSWKSTRPGAYIYEIGDHGSIIVIAKKQVAVTEVEFSWDEGLTWTVLTISEVPVIVVNIIIEPSNLSQQFLVYGVVAPPQESDDQEIQTTGGKAFLTYMDFSGLHMKQCVGEDKPGTASSDFELWSPNDGRHGSASNCFLG